MRHWKVKIKRIKQVTECDSDEGDPGMVPRFSALLSVLPKILSLENGQTPRTAI